VQTLGCATAKNRGVISRSLKELDLLDLASIQSEMVCHKHYGGGEWNFNGESSISHAR